MNIEKGIIFHNKTPTRGLFCIAADTVAMKWLCTQIVAGAGASRFSALYCLRFVGLFFINHQVFFYSLIVLFRLFNTANTFYED